MCIYFHEHIVREKRQCWTIQGHRQHWEQDTEIRQTEQK